MVGETEEDTSPERGDDERTRKPSPFLFMGDVLPKTFAHAHMQRRYTAMTERI